MMYYEELITNPKKTLRGLLNFLNIDSAHLQDFMQHYQVHKKQSLHLYETQEDRSLTHGNKTKHHVQLVHPKELKKFDACIETMWPDLWAQYLKRYAE